MEREEEKGKTIQENVAGLKVMIPHWNTPQVPSAIDEYSQDQ